MKVGVLLSGSGVNDGSEIHESVLTMLFLDRLRAETIMMAPNIDQMHVINHYTGQEMDEYRNVLVESARIARGNIKDMAEIRGEDLNALIIPGGLGASKNLSDFAMSGPECSVNPDVYRIVVEMILAKKPIGAICIAPAIMAKILAEQSLSGRLTVGNDKTTSEDIVAMGSKHQNCSSEEIAIDNENKIVTTPAYMNAESISEAAKGIEKLVDQVVSMAK
jgi:enhancing lycopene biosynthesis protein 2|tara:strand:- start:1782 stop:2441 length:660 start_codon:yes stop_codon:yes gene_type:complete